jgi:two-component system sensor histidine kinase AlgZ
MPKAQSINQNPRADTLPDFCNMGVTLRSILLVNGLAFLAALGDAMSWTEAAQRMAEISALLQPVLLSCLLLLFIFNSVLARLTYWQGAAIVVALAGLVTLAIYSLGGQLYAPATGDSYFHVGRNVFMGSAVAALLLGYFRLRSQALSPALQAARLQALQARIRPHFLFNCINAVLGIVRSNPKRAESALEDMSDLFRTAMASSGNLVSVKHEMALARQYLELEQLRMGERLKVNWHTEELPEDALLPPLMLQPLLENAVYHGIEPLTEGGVIDVRLYRNNDELHLEMYNPRQEQGSHHTGNKMALGNIRERLALQFDIEARYTVESGKDFYRVHIMLPYVKEETP